MPSRRQTAIAAFIVMLGLVLFAAALYQIPKWQAMGLQKQLQQQKPTQINPIDVFNAEDKARGTLATILAGTLVLVGAYFTWRSTKAGEDKQITDRFTAAVINLSADGPEKMALRLGGIYALERIAGDSSDDHWTVMEVLTAYVRDKCLKRPKVGENEISNTNAVPMLPTDIQAILTVIGRRDAGQDKGRLLELHNVDLQKAKLGNANLEGAYLDNACLRRAFLREAKLWGADLTGADLREAVLEKANLTGTRMWAADLCNANLSGAVLQGTRLGGAALNSAVFRGANLTEAELKKADLTKAKLEGAVLRGADLTGAVLIEAKLGRVDLRQATPAGPDLQGADLHEAILLKADLLGADLRDVKNLTQKQLDTVLPDRLPKSLPPGLHAPTTPNAVPSLTATPGGPPSI